VGVRLGTRFPTPSAKCRVRMGHPANPRLGRETWVHREMWLDGGSRRLGAGDRGVVAAFLPGGESGDEAKEKDDDGDDGRLEAKGENAGGDSGLKVDVDGYEHLDDDHEGGEQKDGLSVLLGKGTAERWQEEEEAGDHFADFAGEDGAVGKVALLHLDVEHSVEGLKELEEAEEEHEDSEEEREGIDAFGGHGRTPVQDVDRQVCLGKNELSIDRQVCLLSRYFYEDANKV
jgi:hypothetical protein